MFDEIIFLAFIQPRLIMS